MKIKKWQQFNESANNAQQAYNIVSSFLVRNSDCETAGEALDKYGEELEAKVGSRYAPALDTIVDAFYNIEDYAPDGTPIDVVWDMIENEVY